MDFKFAVITGKTVAGIVRGNYERCAAVVREAYVTHGAGKSVNPNSHFLRFPDDPSSRIIALPAHLGGSFGVSGIKWIASFPANVKRGFPRASAVLLLNDAETGYPFACLESSIISAARTAGSAVLGAEALNLGKRSIGSLGIVGTGLIARYVYEFFLGLGWEIGAVRLHDLQRAEAERFAAQVCRSESHPNGVTIVDGPVELLRNSDVTVLATVAGAPYIEDPKALAGNPIVLNVSLRDLSPRLLLPAFNIVDDVGHVMNAGTSPHLAEQLVGNRDFVAGTLADVLEKRVLVDASKARIFSPFGLGVLDLAVGKWVYDQAVRDGDAIDIEDFFFERTR